MNIRKNSLIKIAAILFLLSIFWSASAFAQPNITSFSGSVVHKGTLTITGTGFGTKAQAAPLKWDDFESGVIGNTLSGWDMYSSNGIDVKYSNSRLRTNSNISAISDFTTSDQYNSSFGFTQNPITRLYVSMWRYVETSGAASRNVKPVRLYGDYGSTNMPDTSNVVFPAQNAAAMGGYGCTSNGHTFWYGNDDDLPVGVWERTEYYWEMSEPGVDNGNIFYWRNGALKRAATNVVLREAGCTNNWNRLRIGNYFARDTYTPTPSAYIWWDDVYVDVTQARVEIGDAPTWTANTHREIQIPSAWSDTSITITMNQGSFSNFNNAYLYVIDADGNVNENGYLLSDGGGGNTPPPSSGSGGDSGGGSGGGSGCGFVKEINGKGQKAKGEGLSFMLILIIILTGIILIKRTAKSFNLILLFLLLPINLYAATLEVGAGKTYSTIQAAVNAAQAGDTVLVYAGTYNQSNTYDFAGTNTTIVHVKNSGTATNPITIKTAESGVILDGGGTINNCFWGRDLSYVVIDGFECRNVNVEAQNPKSGAIYFFKSNFITIQNNNIHSIIQTDYENKACIFLQESNSCIIRGNIIKARSIGITNTMSQRTIIEGNIVDGNDGGTAESPYANGIYVTNSSHDTVITRNYIHDYAYTAIQMRDSYRIIFSYNVVYYGHGGSASGGVCWGVQLRDWPGTGPDGNENDQYKVFNNVIEGPCDYGIVLTQQDNSVLVNNIVLNVGSAIYETNWAAPVHSTNLTIKNNILNSTICAICNFSAVTYTSQNNMENIDPKFVATGARPYLYYLLLSDSPAIDAGASDTPAGTDFIGTAVPQGVGVDIGAFEYCPSGDCSTSDGGSDITPLSSGGGGDTSASGGSGCGFVKDDGKGQGAKGEGPALMIMLIITLAGIAIARRRASLLKTILHIKSSN